MISLNDKVDYIKNLASFTKISSDKEIVSIDNYIVVLMFNLDGTYSDVIQYKQRNELLWTLETIDNFIYSYTPPISYREHSVRFYGEAKLKKPSELKESICLGSVAYIPGKCTCRIYLQGNNIWIKHRDYFSSHDGGSYDPNVNLKKPKFVYNDFFGSVVYRNEAWLCIENLYSKIKFSRDNISLSLIQEILRKQEAALNLDEYKLAGTGMELFFERLVNHLYSIVREKQ